MAVEEVIVPFDEGKDHLATGFRSTLLTTSLQSLRARGLYDRYTALLPAAHREAILTSVAGVWLPMAVGLAHYTTCDSLGLPAAEQFAIGQEVGDRVQGTLLGLVVRTAKTAGLTPWAGLSNSRRLYTRLLQGGSVRLVKLGPKEARIELVNNPLAATSHFRNGFRGVAVAGAELFCQKAYGSELPKMTTPTSFAMRIAWA
jgi:hypothetical protein